MADVLSRLASVVDELAGCDVSQLSDAGVVEAAAVAERLARRTAAAVTDRLVVEASDRNLPRSLGYRDVRDFLAHRLGVGDPAARHRLIAATGSFTSIVGEKGDPQCPTLARHWGQGLIAPARARAVLEVLDQIPHQIPADVRAAAEAQMAGYGVDFTPKEITNLGTRLMAHLDPDGTVTDDTDRKRRRRLWVNRQGADLMSRLTADLDPATRARLDVVLDAWAKPGMNNPDDDTSPVGPVGDADAELVAQAAARDQRSQAQRNHDAVSALLSQVVDAGVLGRSHRGLPIQVIATTTLAELEAHAGVARTASGTLLPIPDLISMATHSTSGGQPFLAVFAEHTSVPLYLGRSKRLASPGQRLALFAAEGGGVCSAPGCTQPASRVAIHHAAKDWAQGGCTDIDQLAPACDMHNSRVGPRPGQYTTRIITDGPDTGRVAWRLNAAPGMPPNPEHINRAADVAADFRDYLATTSTDHVTDDTMASVTRLVPRDTRGAPPTSVIDHRLHTLLGAMTAPDHHDRDIRDRDKRVDITWHPPGHPDHGHEPDPLAA
ncbi:HNH endonuclease [Gordonia otitidis]|uniref:HNH endonuclease signature motif containing protein n=1 Tax=Gordonia otitidis TaxID=249058 RepID=UPI001D146D27|nr:HNH endonuclease signature motif containing protein [Gordonia otitidis]UEA58737.1 HNH endonuclease [Gordonia otitidis]